MPAIKLEFSPHRQHCGISHLNITFIIILHSNKKCMKKKAECVHKKKHFNRWKKMRLP